MNVITDINELEFHDSVIVSVSQEDHIVNLHIEYVLRGEYLVDGTLQINGVERILRGDKEIRVFEMETELGPQIIDFDRNQNEINMLLDWGTLPPNHSYTNMYTISGRDINTSFAIIRRRDDEDVSASF